MKTVGDLMIPLGDYTHVTIGDSLHDAIRALMMALQTKAVDPSRPGDRGVLVHAANGRVVGKLSMWDVLGGLQPQYEPPIDPFGTIDDHFLWSDWLRAGLAEKARSIKVEDLLGDRPKVETIDEKAPLDLAVHRLVRGKYLSLLVTRAEAVVGILRLSDAFKAVGELVTAAQSEHVRV